MSCTDAAARAKILNITEELYCDKSLAEQWRKNIWMKIHNVEINSSYILEAKLRLDHLYNNMIKED